MTSASPILSLSLNTFIKYYAMDTTKLVGEIARRMQANGGYDFYRLSTEAIRAKIRNASDDEIQLLLNASSNLTEISYNRAAYKMFESKFGKKKGIEEFQKRANVKLAGGELQIGVAPVFSLQSAAGFSVYQVWAAQNPELDRTRAGVGVYLMQQAFKKSAPNYDYKVFDAVTGKVYSATSNSTAQAVEVAARSMIDIAKVS
jgi:hypothetical protein